MSIESRFWWLSIDFGETRKEWNLYLTKMAVGRVSVYILQNFIQQCYCHKWDVYRESEAERRRMRHVWLSLRYIVHEAAHHRFQERARELQWCYNSGFSTEKHMGRFEDDAFRYHFVVCFDAILMLHWVHNRGPGAVMAGGRASYKLCQVV